MKKVVFCKYNQSRNAMYRTVTKIYLDSGGERHIEKKALTEAAVRHIQSFPEKYGMTRCLYPNIRFLPCELIGATVRYAYIEGIAADDYLRRRMTDWEDFLGTIQMIFETYYAANDKNRCEFSPTDEFEALFGEVDCSGEPCVCPANVDMIFDNIMFDDDMRATAFDYEWVYDFPVPEDYIKYRVLSRLYDKYFAELSARVDFEDFVEHFSVDRERQARYREMETAFIRNIYRDGETAVSGQSHLVRRKTLSDIRDEEKSLADYKKEYLSTREEYVKTRDAYLTMSREFEKSCEDISRLISENNEAREEHQKQLQEKSQENRELSRANQELSRANQELSRQKQELSQKKRELSREKRILLRDNDILLRDNQSLSRERQSLLQGRQELLEEREMVLNSRSWKLTKPLRWGKKFRLIMRQEGWGQAVRAARGKIKNRYAPEEVPSTYGHVTAPVVLARQRKTKFEKSLKISVLTPLFNTPAQFLREMIESVQAQTYPNWELCLVDFSGEGHPEVEEICAEYAKKDGRIRYKRDPDNRGIAENTNECLKLATGEYIVPLDHDDLLHPAAFYEVMRAVNENGSDFIYTDEIKFKGDLDHVFSPNFKPDFAPEELLAHNYICHLTAYRKELLEQTGSYQKEYDGSQDHDMVLRLTHVAERVTHIPRILYYWRVHEKSVATAIEAKPYATLAGIRAVNAQWKRDGYETEMESIRNNIPCYRATPPRDMEIPAIRVVVWGTKKPSDLGKTLASLEGQLKGGYALSVVTANNKTAGLLEKRNKVLWDALYVGRDMDMSREQLSLLLKNHRDPYFLFLKAGMDITTDDAVREMLVYATREGVAAVDAKILYETGRTFSGGVIAAQALDPPVQYRCRGKEKGEEGFEDVLIHARNVSAVSGICTLLSREDWLAIPEGESPRGNPFIARSLHAGEAKRRLVWTPCVVARGDLRGYDTDADGHSYAPDDIPQEDPFFSSNIKKYGLE